MDIKRCCGTCKFYKNDKSSGRNFCNFPVPDLTNRIISLFRDRNYDSMSSTTVLSLNYCNAYLRKNEFEILRKNNITNEILSIKRLSDNEVFTVWDRVTDENGKFKFYIKEFLIFEDIFLVRGTSILLPIERILHV